MCWVMSVSYKTRITIIILNALLRQDWSIILKTLTIETDAQPLFNLKFHGAFTHCLWFDSSRLDCRGSVNRSGLDTACSLMCFEGHYIGHLEVSDLPGLCSPPGPSIWQRSMEASMQGTAKRMAGVKSWNRQVISRRTCHLWIKPSDISFRVSLTTRHLSWHQVTHWLDLSYIYECVCLYVSLCVFVWLEICVKSLTLGSEFFIRRNIYELIFY